jgi:hypothetical protein
MVTLAAPFASDPCALKLPLARLIVPVGIGWPLPPDTEIITMSLCRSVTTTAEGVTVNVEAAFPIAGATVTLAV